MSSFFDFVSDITTTLSTITKITLVSGLVLIFILPGMNSIPPLDRDEARFSQASKQMLEDKNYVVIKFQEELRSKKPIGIYWLQATSAYFFGEENILSYRIPNIIASILLISIFGIFVYRVSFNFLDQSISSSMTFGLFSALVLSTLLGFSVEIRQAKTDTVLLMLCTIQQLLLWKIYSYGKDQWNQYKHHELVWTVRFLWIIIAFAVLIKGPISPLLFMLTLLGLCILDRISEQKWNLSWLSLLLWFQGILIIITICLPWFYLAWQSTDGALILDAINKDFLGKIKSSQENHWGPFGSHFILLFFTFWPMVLFIPYAGRAFIDWKHHRFIKFLISWVIPFWFILELVPTKLPHYILPTFPGIILLIFIGISSPPSGNRVLHLASQIYRALVIIFTIILSIALLYITVIFSSSKLLIFSGFVLCCALLTSTLSGNLFFLNRCRNKIAPLFAMLIFAGISNAILFSIIIPNLDRIHISPKIVKYINELDKKPDTIVATGYHEPSLVFSLGRDTLLLNPEEAALVVAEGENTIAIVEQRVLKTFLITLNNLGKEVEEIVSFSGINLAKGQKTLISLYKPRQKNSQ